ncbi:MAG: hypothetical protein PCALPYG88_5690 [uncultured Paraburkholderia sp.]|uniref:hypothetical protein n=1 Tax=uncultured Paraburkholderia sp. TaxID=1822466 RepID=UPI0025996B1E|nr:hypothetical protein [uncultured Paraburkholderia sp.]CAH2902165.1 MAG: hypothetical protein PCALPYG08_5854 [uncultured Paraburkholderia sp.]CAH2936428.1 MAG: hypothetical protein PCALPYG88_5690 [uncultured Paraburkholderia sp.]
MELTNVTRPLCPDAQELRMLRALVWEGILASRHGPYAVHFHGWRVRLWRFNNPSMHWLHIEIRCPNGTMWARFARQTVRHPGDEVV